MTFLYAFIIGGLICAIAQFIMDKFKLLPIYVTNLLVVIGSLLDIFHIYDKLVDLAGMGALIPISSFGHAITHGVNEGIKKGGFIGLFTGVFTKVNVGITCAIYIACLFGIFCALKVIKRPKG